MTGFRCYFGINALCTFKAEIGYLLQILVLVLAALSLGIESCLPTFVTIMLMGLPILPFLSRR